MDQAVLNEGLRAKKIGSKIETLRRKKGYNRKEFAGHIGINYVALYQWERGVNIKHLLKFLNLCEKLEVSPAYFLED